MKKFNFLVLVVSLFSLLLIFPEQGFSLAKKKGSKGAFKGGSLSMGLGLGLTTADQSGLNTMINVSKNTVAASTGTFSSGLEYVGHLTYRFSNDLVALQFRPTYFQQSVSGTGSDGSHSYDLTGFTLFPMVRLIPLANEIIDFYIQAGIGYGKLDGSIANGTRKVSFSGSSFGMQVGLGADFCLLPDHCFGIEGNYRYLPITRNIAGSGTGPANLPYGASQAQTDRELEDLNGSDVGTSLTGISGVLGYTYIF